MSRPRPVVLAILALLAAPSALAISLQPAAPLLEPASPAEAPAPRRGGPEEAAADDAGAYSLRFDCPDDAETAPEAEATGTQCPVYVKDVEDIFGQPVLVIDPVDPRMMAFSAMHGGHGLSAIPGQEPPTERSRRDALHQPHTTFMSRDGGGTWRDLPYHAPDSMSRKDDQGRSTREIWGEDNAATLDADGRLYLGALYTYSDRQGSGDPLFGFGTTIGPTQYTAVFWKQKGLERDAEYNQGFANVSTGNDGLNPADGFAMAFVPDAKQVVAVWRETAAEGGANATPASEIVLATSPADQNSVWTLRRTGIGPCEAISAPLAIADRLYVGCFPPESSGMQVHAIEATNWTTNLTGVAPLTVKQGFLISRDAGHHMVAVGAGVSDGRPLLQYAEGEAGAAWEDPKEIAQRVTAGVADPNTPRPGALIEARVTAAAFAPVSGDVHVIYMERYKNENDDPQSTGIFKVLVSFQAGGGYQGMKALSIGTVSRVNSFSPAYTGIGDGVFDDLHDSIVVWKDPVGSHDREFIAVGDYGFVQFAEVKEENPPVPVVPLTTTVPPVPLATAGSVPAIVGLPAGLLAGAAVARTLSNRKKSAVGAGME